MSDSRILSNKEHKVALHQASRGGSSWSEKEEARQALAADRQARKERERTLRELLREADMHIARCLARHPGADSALLSWLKRNSAALESTKDEP